MSLSLRDAAPHDAHAIARVHVATWRTTYRGIVPQAFLDSFDVEARAEDWKQRLDSDNFYVHVAENNTELCGFIAAGPSREPLQDFDAEIYALYLLTSAQGQGAGRLLMERMARTLLAHGFSKVAVWVLAENASRGFYQHLGAKQIARKPITIGDAELIELAYGWQALQTLAGG